MVIIINAITGTSSVSLGRSLLIDRLWTGVWTTQILIGGAEGASAVAAFSCLLCEET